MSRKRRTGRKRRNRRRGGEGGYILPFAKMYLENTLNEIKSIA